MNLSWYHQTHFLLILGCIIGCIALKVKNYGIIHPSEINHSIVKRGLVDNDHPFNKIKEVRFNSLGRNFRLLLSPNTNVLHSKFKAYESDADGNQYHVPIEHDSFHSGRVFGEVNSDVFLHIADGVMTGSIELETDIFHIEPTWRHLPQYNNQTMMIYKQSDVDLDWNKENSTMGVKTCGVEDEYSEEYDKNNLFMREKRQIFYDTENTYAQPTKTRCSLLLVADHTFYKHMGGSSTKTTINYLITLIDRVNKIYNSTVWRDNEYDTGFTGMGFLIKKIVVHNAPTQPNFGEEHYNMIRKIKWNVRHLLEVFSRNPDNTDFCLAHLFTHQTFKTSNSVVLGLAYIASPRKSSHGGICTKEFMKDGFRVFLNSGLSSSSNHYGQRVITREAELVTAHEFGHNWGSEHDPDIPECSPSSRNNGSYLMYSYSVSGLDKNNKEFSPCSIRSIKKVLQAKSDICFSAPAKSFCGNSKVEEDEECDAGLFGTEETDACCDKDCKLRPGAACSDKNSQCCQNCQFMQRGAVCRSPQYSTCQEQSECTGWHSHCPPSPPVQNGADCQEKGKCWRGQCVPFCETRGLLSCMCDTAPNACKRCCRSSFNGTCSPPESDNILPDGTPCMYGFCKNGQCEKTNPEFVERFWTIIDTISINKILQFFKDNIVGSVVIVTAAIWIPACYFVNKIDKRRRKERRQQMENCFNYAPPETEQVLHIKVPRHRKRREHVKTRAM